jgi:hypothetical protein
MYMYLLFVLLDLLLVHSIKCLKRKLEVRDESIAACLGKVFANDNTHQLHLFRMRCHGVGGNDPATLSQLVGTN